MEIYFTLFKSGLPNEEVLKKFEERADKYREVKGLIQKYYVHDESSGEFGGIYVFDSKENLEVCSQLLYFKKNLILDEVNFVIDTTVHSCVSS